MTKRDRIVRDILWQVAAVLSKLEMPYEIARTRALIKLYALLDKLEDLK